MYTPNKYKNNDIEEIREFIKNNGFGILINTVDGKPWATHLPMEIYTDKEGNNYLEGHVAKANPQWQYFNNDEQVLCIFNGPHSYISSSWYQEEEVPTWNYIAVHVYGHISVVGQQETLMAMERLVDKYEENMEYPIELNKLSTKTLAQVRSVVGFKIKITGIEATYKLSQGMDHNHPKIIDKLKQGGGHAPDVANEIEKRCPF